MTHTIRGRCLVPVFALLAAAAAQGRTWRRRRS
jgi:hypothetical protein